MQRIGIQNYYVVSPEHAWNIVTIKDENNKDVSFAVDLTWDVCVGERYGKKSFKNFGFPVELDDSKVSHIPSNLDDFMLFKSCKELSSEYKKEVFQSLQTGNKEKEN